MLVIIENRDNINLNDLTVHKNELCRHYEKICKYDDQVQEVIVLSDISKDIADCSKWSLMINNVIHRTDVLLSSSQGGNVPSEANSVASVYSDCVRNVKLPTIQLPTFDGSYLAWQNFWDLYESTVHVRTDIGKASKFHYLVSQLTGDAAKLMVGFNYTDAEYEEAIELLKSTYGKPSYLIDAHLNAVIDLQPPSPTTRELSSFRSSYEGHLRAMKSLKADVDAAGFVFAAILLRKLPPNVRDNMNRECRTDNWDLKSLCTAIETEIGHLKASEQASFNETNPRNERKPIGEEYRSATILTTATTPSTTARACYLCKSPRHGAQNCDVYQTIDQRRDQIRKLKLCYNCLRDGHSSRDCKSNSNCRKCQKRHHTYLYVIRRGSNVIAETFDETTTKAILIQDTPKETQEINLQKEDTQTPHNTLLSLITTIHQSTTQNPQIPQTISLYYYQLP